MSRTCFLIISIYFFACSPKAKVPKDVLPPKVMHSVLWDMIRADELAQQLNSEDTSANRFSKNVPYYQTVLKVHKVTEKQFKQSLAFYEKHPDLMKVVLDLVQEKANGAPDTLGKKKPE